MTVPTRVRPFRFLAQASAVQELLNQCQSALVHLPDEVVDRLVPAMSAFETCSCATTWSIFDVVADIEPNKLSAFEKRAVVNRFVQESEASDSDWTRIGQLVQAAISERETTRREPMKLYFNDATQSGFMSKLVSPGLFLVEEVRNGAVVESHTGGFVECDNWLYAKAMKRGLVPEIALTADIDEEEQPA